MDYLNIEPTSKYNNELLIPKPTSSSKNTVNGLVLKKIKFKIDFWDD